LLEEYLQNLSERRIMEKPIKKNKTAKEETSSDLKKESSSTNAVKKGYNEKNPSQPQGAFKPDSKKDEQSS